MVAATFFGAVAQLGARINHTPVPPLQRAMEDAMTQTRQQFGGDFQIACDAGQTCRSRRCWRCPSISPEADHDRQLLARQRSLNLLR